MNYVIIANIEWGFLKQRHQFIAEKLNNEKHNVIFIESSAKRNPKIEDIPRIISRVLKLFFRRREDKSSSALTPYIDEIHVISPVVFPSTNFLFRLFNRLFFIQFLVKRIRSRFDNSGITRIVCYLPSTTSIEIINRVEHELLSYDCVSNFEGIKTMPKDTVTIENRLIELADNTYVDCDFLFDKHKNKTQNIFQLEPGVYFELFNSIASSRVVRSEIKSLLYYGLVSDRVDMKLLSQLIKSGFEVTLVGPVRRNVDVSPGIKILPAVSIDKLPEIIRNFDALLIPYVQNEYTKGIIPAKFFECFATGLPIVVTKQYNYKRYEPLLITGDNHQHIIANIINYDLQEDFKSQSKKRIEIAKKHSWDNFIQQFLAYENKTITNNDIERKH